MSLPHVTDHAVLQYLKRAKGYAIEDVRRHIAILCRHAAASGATSLQTENVRFQIGDGVVITAKPVRPRRHNGGTRPNKSGGRR